MGSPKKVCVRSWKGEDCAGGENGIHADGTCRGFLPDDNAVFVTALSFVEWAGIVHASVDSEGMGCKK